MSMKVDLSTPLTPAERAYLAGRGQYQEIERADAMHGVTDAPALGDGDGTGTIPVSLLSSDQAASEVERLKARLRDLGVDVPDGDGEEADTPPYESWKVAELDAELERRSLPVTGNKSEKVDALYANDEQTAV